MSPSEPMLFRMRCVVDSSIRTVLLVNVTLAIVPGRSRRSLKGRATGMPDDSGEALFFEQPDSSTSAAMHTRHDLSCNFNAKLPARLPCSVQLTCEPWQVRSARLSGCCQITFAHQARASLRNHPPGPKP